MSKSIVTIRAREVSDVFMVPPPSMSPPHAEAVPYGVETWVVGFHVLQLLEYKWNFLQRLKGMFPGAGYGMPWRWIVVRIVL